MIKPCPCGHRGCKSYVAPPLVNCACNSLTRRQALLIDAAEVMQGALVVAKAAINDLVEQLGDPNGKMQPALRLVEDAIAKSEGGTK